MIDVNDVSVLPVELLSFEAKNNDKTVDLTWATASEGKNAGFDIERSADGKTFDKIGFVKGSGTTSEKHSYTFTDNTPLSTTAYYRLQQVDFDGSKVSSNVISVESKDEVKGIKVYPNPVSNVLTIETEATGNYQIFNLLGQQILRGSLSAKEIDVSALPKGSYILKAGEKQIKFVKN